MNLMNASLQYHNADVREMFPTLEGDAGKDESLVIRGVSLMVGNNNCDGIVALWVGTVLVTMGTDDARKLAAMLTRQADTEDAKLEGDGDGGECSCSTLGAASAPYLAEGLQWHLNNLSDRVEKLQNSLTTTTMADVLSVLRETLCKLSDAIGRHRAGVGYDRLSWPEGHPRPGEHVHAS